MIFCFSSLFTDEMVMGSPLKITENFFKLLGAFTVTVIVVPIRDALNSEESAYATRVCSPFLITKLQQGQNTVRDQRSIGGMLSNQNTYCLLISR